MDTLVVSNFFPKSPESAYLSSMEKEQLAEADALICCVQNQDRLWLAGLGGSFLSIGCSALPLITRVSGDKSKGKTVKNNPPLTLSHDLSHNPKKGHNPLSSGRMCFCGAWCERKSPLAVPLRCVDRPSYLGG